MSEEDIDHVAKFISLIVPVCLIEYSRRDAAIKHLRSNRVNMDDFIENLSSSLIRECESGRHHDSDHIKNLKNNLQDLFDNAKKQLTAEIRDEIKDEIKAELRMDLFMELDSMRKNMSVDAEPARAKPNRSKVSVREAAGTSCLPVQKSYTGTIAQFSSKLSARPTDRDYDSNANLSNAESITEMDLSTNPLYLAVTKNIERLKSGKSAYTAEELIAARGDRIDVKHSDMIRVSAQSFNYDLDDEPEEEDDQWDRLLKLKLNM